MRNVGRSGQVLVEMLLILPVFFAIVFTIMEIGYISFRVILLNHATYEVARIGSMSAKGSPQSACDPSSLTDIMSRILREASVTCTLGEPPLEDPQSHQPNFDLIVTAQEDIRFLFPTSRLIFRRDTKPLTATVRMPIEMPLDK